MLEEDFSASLEVFWDQEHSAPPIGVLKDMKPLVKDPGE